MDTSAIQHGIVCFTFDDARYNEWLPLLPLFEKYNARMTFFFNRTITDEALAAMRSLLQHHHSIGLHSLNHRDAVAIFAEQGGQAYLEEEVLPQLEVCRQAGIDIHNYAYPNNLHSAETDAFLMEHCGFTRFRAGLGKKLPTGYCIAEQDCAFLELEKIPSACTLGGPGIGSYYSSTQENLDGALERAARENRLLTFFSHGISMEPGRVDVSIPMLENSLKKANELEMAILGFDDLV